MHLDAEIPSTTQVKHKLAFNTSGVFINLKVGTSWECIYPVSLVYACLCMRVCVRVVVPYVHSLLSVEHSAPLSFFSSANLWSSVVVR